MLLRTEVFLEFVLKGGMKKEASVFAMNSNQLIPKSCTLTYGFNFSALLV